METTHDQQQDPDTHGQTQKDALQTSIPLAKSLKCCYRHDGQDPGPLNHRYLH